MKRCEFDQILKSDHKPHHTVKLTTYLSGGKDGNHI